jgi:hypothetical protein
MLFYIVSCSPFDTRNPEEPDLGSSAYIPPTSPDIVVSNFIESVSNKNIDNYITCFQTNSGNEIEVFNFYPSSDALNNYPNIFSGWNSDDERRYFLSVLSIIPENINPGLEFNSPDFESLTPDSAIYSTDYLLTIPNNSSVPELYEGVLQFTIVPDENSFWRIKSWRDTKRNSGDSLNTWSILKALMY